MTGENLSIRLAPVPGSVALSRTFVGGVLGVFGAPDQDVEDVRLTVSDLATGLVGAGVEIEIRANVEESVVVLEGNCLGVLPETGLLLLGDRMTWEDQRWAITIQAS